jgi:hypothetical protein
MEEPQYYRNSAHGLLRAAVGADSWGEELKIILALSCSFLVIISPTSCMQMTSITVEPVSYRHS